MNPISSAPADRPPAYVLTVNPADAWAGELLSFVKGVGPWVRIAEVEEFGRPELRLGRGAYVTGAWNIIQHLKTHPR